MTQSKVFVSRPYHPAATALLEQNYEVEVWPHDTTPPVALLKDKVAECVAIFVESYDPIGKEVLSAAKALRVISNRAVGTDNLDIPEATRLGILIGNTPGLLAESCADLTFGLMLDVGRRIAYSDRQVRSGEWKVLTQVPYIGTDVHGKTLGLVGMGRIALAVARRASGFDMRVVYYSRTRKLEIEAEHGVEWKGDLASLLEESDYVSLHIPLTDETEGLIGRKELALMKREAFLINAARGKIVDWKALYDALVDGVIAGAGLDVTVPEPVAPDDPLIALPNVVITPHLASGSSATFEKMALMAARNIIAAVEGKPMPSCLNAEALENRSRR